jgi:hypothetical protein
MADKTIGALTEVTSLSGGEEMEIEQSGNSRKVKVATAAEIRSDMAGRILSTDEVWDAAASADLGNLTGMVALDFSTFLGLAHGVVTGNITLDAITNGKPGQTVVLDLAQDGTGSRTIAYNTSYWLTPAGEIEWDDTANARNILIATVLNDGKAAVTCVTSAGGLE